VLTLKPITLKDARRFIDLKHRHCRMPQGGLVAVSCWDGLSVRGVAILGRPRRGLQDGWTCEITRVGTDGVRNGCSILYGSLIRTAKSLGYQRVVTYTLKSESGSSLKAVGFIPVAEVKSDDGQGRKRYRMRTDLFGEKIRDEGPKVRWEISFWSNANLATRPIAGG